ncbi:MAG: DUF58 domain-containing protein [Solirubrobacterales bacterium]
MSDSDHRAGSGAARVIVALGAALLAAGLGFGAPSLVVPGVALLAGDLGMAAWVRYSAARSGIGATAGPWSVTEGDPYPLRVAVSGPRVPLPGGRLEHPLLAAAVDLGPGLRWRGERTLELAAPARGRHLLEPPVLVVTDPFGLHSARLSGGEPTPVMVLPRIEPVSAPVPSGGGTGTAGAFASGRDAGSDWRTVDFELDGVRPFREGSPASRIHWPTVARSGELFERRLTGGGRSLPAVVLDSRDPVDGKTLDAAVRAAASLCANLLDAGGCLLALPGERRARRILDPGGWREAHAALAQVEEGPPCPEATALGAGAAFVVSASRAPRARGHHRGAETWLLSPGQGPVTGSPFSVAGFAARPPDAPRRAGVAA